MPVALKYYQPVQKYVKLGNGHEYVFVPRANISLAMVDEVDVDKLLSLRKTCCGRSSSNPMFRWANEDDIRRWTNGGGR